ncbi:hypothetical protein ACFPRL_17480 [Pseudoclavibacter helvolus]
MVRSARRVPLRAERPQAEQRERRGKPDHPRAAAREHDNRQQQDHADRQHPGLAELERREEEEQSLPERGVERERRVGDLQVGEERGGRGRDDPGGSARRRDRHGALELGLLAARRPRCEHQRADRDRRREVQRQARDGHAPHDDGARVGDDERRRSPAVREAPDDRHEGSQEEERRAEHDHPLRVQRPGVGTRAVPLGLAGGLARPGCRRLVCGTGDEGRRHDHQV